MARPPRPPPFTGAHDANVAGSTKPQEVLGRDVPSGGEAYESWIEIFMLVVQDLAPPKPVIYLF